MRDLILLKQQALLGRKSPPWKNQTSGLMLVRPECLTGATYMRHRLFG